MLVMQVRSHCPGEGARGGYWLVLGFQGTTVLSRTHSLEDLMEMSLLIHSVHDSELSELDEESPGPKTSGVCTPSWSRCPRCGSQDTGMVD